MYIYDFMSGQYMQQEYIITATLTYSLLHVHNKQTLATGIRKVIN